MAFVIRRNPAGVAEFVDAALDANIASIKATVEASKVVLDATKLTADDILDKICAEQLREVFVYPESTARTCTITAGNPANTWSAWAEVIDSLGTTFSSKVTSPTHITMTLPESVSDRAEMYFFELSYGAAKVSIARRRFAPDRELGVIGVDLYGKLVPVGEIVYGRMMCTRAGETADIAIRYHYHV